MLSTRINKLFRISYPIIQAGMVWTAGWKLAAAVCENDCLGQIGSGSMKPELLKEHITKLRAYFLEKKIEKPFGVNIPLIRGDSQALINSVINEGVKIVFTSAGNPAVYTKQLKDAGITVTHVISSVRHALKAQDAGCDAEIG